MKSNFSHFIRPQPLHIIVCDFDTFGKLLWRMDAHSQAEFLFKKSCQFLISALFLDRGATVSGCRET